MQMNSQILRAAEAVTSRMHYQAYTDQALLPFSHVDFVHIPIASQAQQYSYT